jgi:hypothetical protein
MQVSGRQDQCPDASDSLVFGIGSITLPAQPPLAVQLRTLGEALNPSLAGRL